MKGAMRCGVVMLAVVSLLIACQRQEERPDDTAIALAVRERFLTSNELRGATAYVQVAASDGVVTLAGTADTAEDRALAETFARGATGVREVTNRIEVTGMGAGAPLAGELDDQTVRAIAARNGEQIGETADDARIYQAIRRQIVAEPITPARSIFVDVSDGNVTLRGTIFSDQAGEMALNMAQRVEGVRGLTNGLRVDVPY